MVTGHRCSTLCPTGLHGHRLLLQETTTRLLLAKFTGVEEYRSTEDPQMATQFTPQVLLHMTLLTTTRGGIVSNVRS